MKRRFKQPVSLRYTGDRDVMIKVFSACNGPASGRRITVCRAQAGKATGVHGMVHMDGQDATGHETGHEAGAHLKDRTELLFVRTYGDGAYMAFRDLYLIYDAWTVERALREAMAYNPVNPVRYIAAICARECRQRVVENGGRPSSGTAAQRDSGEVIL